MAGLTSLLGDGLDFATNLWEKNNQYQAEKKRLEYLAAQERASAQKSAADAAASVAEAVKAANVNTIIKWTAIGVIGLVGGNILFRFLSRQLKGA